MRPITNGVKTLRSLSVIPSYFVLTKTEYRINGEK